jgi:hypothetical protein
MHVIAAFENNYLEETDLSMGFLRSIYIIPFRLNMMAIRNLLNITVNLSK